MKKESYTKKMNRYDASKGNGLEDQKWGNFKIIVPTEEDKKQLLLASEYIHNLSDIDSDYMMVNALMHLYLNPELIEVS